jgi:hypothetical protein
MISSIVVFVLAFAALGLLLGFAETYHVQSQSKPVGATTTGAIGGNNNATSLMPNKQASVQAPTAG